MKNIIKDIIADSFMKLCTEVPFTQLKVKDIYSYCDVSKQTFYNHFSDKYDVMHYIYKRDAESIISQIASDSWFDVKAAILKMLQICHTHRNYYVSIGKYTGQNDFFEIFFKDATRSYTKHVEAITKIPLTPEMEFAIRFNCYGVAHIFIDWILGGMKEEPEFIAKNAEECMPQQLREVLVSNLPPVESDL